MPSIAQYRIIDTPNKANSIGPYTHIPYTMAKPTPASTSENPLMDLTASNITPNAISINTKDCPSPRTRFLLSRLITHLHAFARETRLSTEEWQAGLDFLTETGQACTETRHEFILLSDVLGLSMLVEGIDHPKPAYATEGTVLGPFHTHDAQTMENGEKIIADEEGELVLVLGTVKDRDGAPVKGVKVDVWETDSTGHYDVQRSDRAVAGPDGRAVLYSDDQGGFWFKAIKPVSYPIPHDGPVGRMLEYLGRHPYRPAHMHFMLGKEGFDELVTSFYMRGDPYESSDAVFGVKSSLVVDLTKITDQEMAAKYDVPVGTSLLKQDFILVSEEEAKALRDRNSIEALTQLGMKVRIVEGLPIPDVD